MTTKAYYQSPFGILEFIFQGDFLTALNIHTNEKVTTSLTHLSQKQVSAVYQLKEYFKGQRQNFDIDIRFETGTAFEQSIWMALVDIPFGKTITYSDVAYKIGKDVKSSQAVGRAVGQNPIAIIVPCHRVMGKNGQLTGFAWGLERKAFLLELEQKQTIGVQGRLF